jgi:uncharacterized protein YjaZ
MNKEKNIIHLIGIPLKYRKTIKSISLNSLKKIRKVFDYKKRIEIVIFESQDIFTIQKIGIGASAVGKSGIIIYIDFSNKNIEKTIKKEISSSIFHEATHLIREFFIGYDKNLLDYIISEGITCFTEKSLNPNKKIPYIEKVKNEKNILKKYQKIFKNKNFDYSEWFLGTGKLPKYIGYRIGFLIVDKYLKKYKENLKNLIKLKSDFILKKIKL